MKLCGLTRKILLFWFWLGCVSWLAYTQVTPDTLSNDIKMEHPKDSLNGNGNFNLKFSPLLTNSTLPELQQKSLDELFKLYMEESVNSENLIKTLQTQLHDSQDQINALQQSLSKSQDELNSLREKLNSSQTKTGTIQTLQNQIEKDTTAILRENSQLKRKTWINISVTTLGVGSGTPLIVEGVIRDNKTMLITGTCLIGSTVLFEILYNTLF